MNRWIFLLLSCTAFADHFVTYEFSGGRFGDNLLSYLHAKWLSYRYDIPLLYKPFKFSSDLTFHDKDQRFNNSYYNFRHRAGVVNIGTDRFSAEPFLFMCPYFPEDPIEREEDHYYFFDVDWKNVGFRKAALEAIAPNKPIRLIEPPANTVNLAVHVRDGENFDWDDFRIKFPLKLPPFSFYLEALPKILELFRGKEIYCYIFTDAECPERIAETFKTIVPAGISVKFGYRRGLNRHFVNVLEDFFSLFRFDALLRSQSNFSMIPSLLQDYAVLCYPSGISREGARPQITKIEIEIDNELYQRLLREK